MMATTERVRGRPRSRSSGSELSSMDMTMSHPPRADGAGGSRVLRSLADGRRCGDGGALHLLCWWPAQPWPGVAWRGLGLGDRIVPAPHTRSQVTHERKGQTQGSWSTRDMGWPPSQAPMAQTGWTRPSVVEATAGVLVRATSRRLRFPAFGDGGRGRRPQRLGPLLAAFASHPSKR